MAPNHGKDLGVIGRAADLEWHFGGHAPAVAWAALNLTLIGNGVVEGALGECHGSLALVGDGV